MNVFFNVTSNQWKTSVKLRSIAILDDLSVGTKDFIYVLIEILGKIKAFGREEHLLVHNMFESS